MRQTQKKRRQLCMGIVTNPSMRKSIHGTSYISKNYIDWFEQHGIRIVPIPYDTTEYERYFSMINGLCIPGAIKGENHIHPIFLQTITHFYKLSLTSDYFPIWAECLGFYLLMYITGQLKTLKEYNATGDYPIYPTMKPSRLLQSFSASYLHYLEHYHSTYHDHFYGISPDHFMKRKRLHHFYHVAATAFDKDGKECVAIIEAKKYPIYGLAFHPWGMKHAGPFIDFIRSELRKNKHECPLIPYVHRTRKHYTYKHSLSEIHEYYYF